MENLEPFKVYIAEYRTQLTNKFKNRKKWTPPNKNHILSVIPGTILKILVKEKQMVKEGEIVMILEAMKMANRITMPVDGVIKTIHVKEGQIVPKNHIMIEIDPQ